MISRANWPIFAAFDSSSINRLLPPLVSLVLVVLIGWQLAKAIWMLVPGSATGVAVPLPAGAPQQTTVSVTRTNVDTIAASHIFGVADQEELPPTPVDQPDDVAGPVHRAGGHHQSRRDRANRGDRIASGHRE